MRSLGEDPEVLVINLQNLWFAWWYAPWPASRAQGWEARLTRIWNSLFALVVVPLYLVSVSRRPWREPAPGLLHLVVLSILVTLYLSFGEARFRVPYDPFFLILGLQVFARRTDRLGACEQQG